MKKRENKEEIENQSKKEREREGKSLSRKKEKEREYQSKNICNFDNFVDLLCIKPNLSL